MFDRFVRLAQARRALQGGRLEEALRLTEDPLLAGHRRTDDLRAAACRALVVRAGSRVGAGDATGAKADCQLALRVRPDDGAAADQLAAVLRGIDAGKVAQEACAGALAQARQAMTAGDLDTAERLLTRDRALDAEAIALQRRITARRAEGREVADAARRALSEGQHQVARDLLVRARALDRGAHGVEETALRLAAESGRRLGEELSEQLAGADPVDVADRYAREQRALPELSGHPAFARARRRIAQACHGRLHRALAEGRLEDAVDAWRRVPAELASTEQLAGIGAVVAQLTSALAHRTRGEYELAADAFAAATSLGGESGAGVVAVVEAAAAARRDATAIDSERRRAREALAAGDLAGARADLDAALIRWPLSRSLQAELKGLDDSARERERLIAQVREVTREGKLRQANAQVLSLTSPGATGEAARQLQVEIQARLDQVAAGLDQVLRDLHGRASASEDGVAQCLARLDGLAKIQVDHEDLTHVRAALAAELRGLGLLTGAREALEVAGPDLIDTVREIVAVRPLLLTNERLDARILSLADLLIDRANRALANGRTRPADRCLAALRVIGGVLPGVSARVVELETRRADAGERAVVAAAKGHAALAARDLASAESSLDVAVRLAEDEDAVQALSRDVAALRDRLGDLDAIDELASRQEYARAQERLASLPPTPALLRTKIYDMKRSLARSQGLDGGFLLRVDEGGEFLVLRGDSISIGNLRDASSDITVLANIASHHARIQRRMTFHGGMEDRIRADRGELFLAGRSAPEHRLRDGDEVRLGQQLQLGYRLPSSRSLSAVLRLRGGFQTCGTDKILLLKDRGRDGRILIGNAADAHVPLSVETPEVELFASKDGQIRVRWAGEGGAIDGRPFTGEHPVIAGAVVTCGQISFVLLPRP